MTYQDMTIAELFTAYENAYHEHIFADYAERLADVRYRRENADQIMSAIRAEIRRRCGEEEEND